MLSGNTTKGEIAYGIIAGLIWLTWVAISTASHFRSRGTTKGETGEKLMNNKATHDSNGNGMTNRTA